MSSGWAAAGTARQTVASGAEVQATAGTLKSLSLKFNVSLTYHYFLCFFYVIINSHSKAAPPNLSVQDSSVSALCQMINLPSDHGFIIWHRSWLYHLAQPWFYHLPSDHGCIICHRWWTLG